MALSSLHPLMRIESANTAAFCCLHRLTIHDDNRWTSTSTGLNSRHLVKSSLDIRPNPCIVPTPKAVIHRAPDREPSRQQAPLTTFSEYIQNRIKHRTNIGWSW